jgi:hypothetical protein
MDFSQCPPLDCLSLCRVLPGSWWRVWLIQNQLSCQFRFKICTAADFKISGLCVGFNSGDYFWGTVLGLSSGAQFWGSVLGEHPDRCRGRIFGSYLDPRMRPDPAETKTVHIPYTSTPMACNSTPFNLSTDD